MNKKQSTSKIKMFLNFPGRINTYTVFLIILLYAFLLYFIANITYKPANYLTTFENLNYTPGTDVEYTDLNPCLLVRGTVFNKSEEEGVFESELRYRMFAYIYTVGSATPKRVRYAYSLLDSAGRMRYLYESQNIGFDVTASAAENRQVLTHSDLAGKDVVLDQESITKYFIKLRYNDAVNDKIIKISESAITIDKKEIREGVFRLKNKLDDILEIVFTVTDYDKDRYETTFRITFDKGENAPQPPVHLNMQSWIITKDGTIYPFYGLYNFRTLREFKPGSKGYIYKFINPEYIYVKLEFTDSSNEVHYLYHRVAISDLLEE